jgi:hypothetical protein
MMTSTITEVTMATIGSTTYADVIAILLLVVLLVFKEFARTFGGSRATIWMQVLNIVIVPLLLVFVFIILVRFVKILGLV